MGSHTESGIAGPAGHSTHGVSTQPICSQVKKAEQRLKNNKPDIMATIADDDDRLLVRIGYTPVCSLLVFVVGDADLKPGLAETLLTMVNRVLCDLDSWSARISASNIWRSYDLWRTCNMCVGMVHR